ALRQGFLASFAGPISVGIVTGKLQEFLHRNPVFFPVSVARFTTRSVLPLSSSPTRCASPTTRPIIDAWMPVWKVRRHSRSRVSLNAKTGQINLLRAETMFDPYRKWLDIQSKEQPPNHYRLLSVDLFENDLDVIEGAADWTMASYRFSISCWN